MWYGRILIQTDCHRGIAFCIAEESVRMFVTGYHIADNRYRRDERKRESPLDIPKSHILQYLPYEQKNQSGFYIYISNRTSNNKPTKTNSKNGGKPL